MRWLILLIFIMGCVPVAQEALQVEAPEETVEVSEPSNLVEVTEAGFVPKMIRVGVGDVVTWVNSRSRGVWVASVVHPTHTVYPGSDISKCPSKGIFDACHGLRQGESYSFTFNEVGSWSYHNHLNPSETGTVIVE